ncbi:MAG: 2-C-methyl-D-erythritol 2,4-cyclodiphosphate synthase [Bacillota bacterium]|nr:2-C-methyl-D-erythritol 2,4-cyclodiphosphate synthase [Bacillota bacterium]
MFRIGNGYDVHRLRAGSKMRIGGIDIPSDYEIVAHSDGDIVIHALMDSILGALGEDDIGTHFPDTDERYKGADSSVLLEQVLGVMKDKGYQIENIDITVVLEKPKLRKHIPNMKKTLAGMIDIEEGQLNIKATTSERMGFVGRAEGIESYSVCLLSRR